LGLILVEFHEHGVIYPAKNSPYDYASQKPVRVSLHNIWPRDPQTDQSVIADPTNPLIAEFRTLLNEQTKKLGGTLISYTNGTLTFEVY
jgi:hypothetical protein